jgi:hypothetical protein
MYRSTVRPGEPGIPRCCYGVPYGWHGMNMKVEPTISAQKNPGLPLRAAAVRLLGGVGGWGVGALRELAATTNKSLPRQQPRGPSAERARGGGWRACATASTSARRLRLQLSDRTAYAKAAPPKTRAPAAPKVNAPSAQTKHIRKHLETNRSRTATWERDNSATTFPTPGLFAARG